MSFFFCPEIGGATAAHCMGMQCFLLEEVKWRCDVVVNHKSVQSLDAGQLCGNTLCIYTNVKTSVCLCVWDVLLFID